jgi:nucleotide-binding universal stress UspA family protein
MKSLEKILVPVDYSTTSGIALEKALSLAHAFGASIEVLHVWNDGGYVNADIGSDVLRLIAERAKEQMSTFLSKIKPPQGVAISSRVQPGLPWEVITSLSRDYDLVVMGTHGRTGFDRLMLGSVAARVVQHADCPVLTIREPGAQPQKQRTNRREQQIVYAMFEDRGHIESAFDELTKMGIAVEDISLVMSEDTHDRDFKLLDRTKALKGAAAGGLMGGAIGGILGGLIGVGSIVTGGIGLIVMGPALAFGAAGGLFGGLLGRTVPDDRALVLKAELIEGKTLMAVHLQDPTLAEEVRALTVRCGAEPFVM